jgi:SAM-dependent methyltransferase
VGTNQASGRRFACDTSPTSGCRGGVIQDNNFNSRRIFSLIDRGIRGDRVGIRCATPERFALSIARRVQGMSVLDPFCGLGGNTIAFARLGKRVLACDTNAKRLKDARHNATIYRVDHLINFKLMDGITALRQENCEAVYLDPPFRRRSKIMRLSAFSPEGLQLLDLALTAHSEVLMYIPEPFALDELYDQARRHGCSLSFIRSRVWSCSVGIFRR